MRRILLYKDATVFEGVRPVKQSRSRSLAMKPAGLWYSVGNSWRDWCRDEMPDWLENYTRVYGLTVTESRMLFIRSSGEFSAFERLYCREPEPATAGLVCVDWWQVAQDYAGIEIAPYRSEKRHEPGSFWYYPWDVASGCLWRPEALTRFRELDRAKYLDRRGD